MIVVRGNTLPNFDIIMSDKNLTVSDEYKNRDKWQHMPQLAANEIAAKNKNNYPSFSFSFKSQETSTCELKKSMYNVLKTYDNGDTIIINTASEAVVILNKEESQNFDRINAASPYSEFIGALLDLGFLVKTNEDETFKFDILRNQFAYEYGGCVNITIYPTQDCNARCFYCFEQNEEKTKMTPATAQSIIDYITAKLTKEDELVYRWFGGEPLMAIDIIDQIIEGVDSYFGGELKYHSIIITNNSLIDDELLDKFSGKWHVRKVQTTIDGYKEEHNNRKAYVDTNKDYYNLTLDNIRKILKKDIFVICRFNFDKNNYKQFSDVLNDLEEFKNNEKFFIHATTLRNKCHPEDIAKKIYIYPEDYEWFYKYVLNELFQKGFYKDVINVLPLRARNNCLACSIGGLVINSEGKFFRCLQHSLDENNCVGSCQQGVLHNEAYKKWFKLMNTLPKDCKTCPYLPCCQGGCKHYRIENKPDASPCLREKFYINVILDLVYKHVNY